MIPEEEAALQSTMKEHMLLMQDISDFIFYCKSNQLCLLPIILVFEQQ
jgi:hypothetical protein